MFIFATSGIVFFVFLAIWIWALIDVVTSRPDEVRNLPKIAWLIIVLLLPDVGALAWIFLGRPRAGEDRLGPREPRRIGVRRSAPGPEIEVDRGPITDRRSAELDRQLDDYLARKAELDADVDRISGTDTNPESPDPKS